MTHMCTCGPAHRTQISGYPNQIGAMPPERDARIQNYEYGVQRCQPAWLGASLCAPRRPPSRAPISRPVSRVTRPTTQDPHHTHTPSTSATGHAMRGLPTTYTSLHFSLRSLVCFSSVHTQFFVIISHYARPNALHTTSRPHPPHDAKPRVDGLLLYLHSSLPPARRAPALRARPLLALDLSGNGPHRDHAHGGRVICH